MTEFIKTCDYQRRGDNFNCWASRPSGLLFNRVVVWILPCARAQNQELRETPARWHGKYCRHEGRLDRGAGGFCSPGSGGEVQEREMR